LKKLLFIIALCLCANIGLQAQVVGESEVQDSAETIVLTVDADSVSVAVPDTNFFILNHSPKKATWFSAVCPGLGQAYNHKYWKIPIIYGAFMGLSYGIMWNHQYFTDYKNGYIDFLKGNPNPTWQDLVVPGKESDASHLSWVKKVLQQKRDRYRRWRDMCIIGMVGVYALNILDAFVDAQLMGFDISQDLSMNVAPNIMYTCDKGSSYGLQFQLHF